MTHGLDINKKDPQIVRIPFIDEIDLRSGQESLLTKDRYLINGYFEALKNPLTQEIEYHFTKRPGFTSFLTISPTNIGRGLYFWKKTGKTYSVSDSHIFSNSTDLNVTMSTNMGFVEFAETRPGATTQYLGINDGSSLYLIDINDTVIVLNNIPVTNVSVANPTHITAVGHGLNTGNKVILRNITPATTPNINDTVFTITKLDNNTFTIPVNVTVGGAVTGTIGVFPTVNTGSLSFMDGYWFTIKPDNTIWNCAVDDPTSWPVLNFINAQMMPGIGMGLARQGNYLVAMSDRHFQTFIDNANPVGSPLQNVEQGMQQIGCVAAAAISSLENHTYWISNTLSGGYSISHIEGITSLKDIGTPTLRRSLTENFFLNAGSVGTKTVILTSGTTWTVPSDFNKQNNMIEAIGGGSGGFTSPDGIAGGHGGGGGAYSKITNFDPLGAPTITYAIGAGSSGGATPAAGGDTSFNIGSLIAKGAAGAGTGGLASASTPSAPAFSGGDGGSGNANGAAAGGGGAAGLNANGNNGGGGSTGTAGGNGGQGDGTFGGIGGTRGLSTSDATVGGNGLEWTTVGSGGGGGGGASVTHINGATGGLYGAGGGGAGPGGTAGAGTNGLIVISYIPLTITDATSATGFLLRISGHIFYIVNLLNSKETWVYDQDLGIWYKWISPTGGNWAITKTTQASNTGLLAGIVGQDGLTGNLYTISPSQTQDNGVNFSLIVQTNPLTYGTMARKYYTRAELIGDKQSSTANVLLSFTDDDFTTFSATRTLDMSQNRMFTRNLGNARRRAWKVSYTGNTPLRLQGIEFTIELDAS